MSSQMPRPESPGPGTNPPRKARGGWWQWVLLALALAGVGVLLFTGGHLSGATAPHEVAYSQFLSQADAGQVKSVTIAADGAIDAVMHSGATETTTLPTAVGDPTLVSQLVKDGVTVTATPASSSGSTLFTLAFTVLPFLLLIGLLVWSSRAASRQLAGMGSGFGIGRARARLVSPERPAAGFADIAGYEPVKREIMEVVDYLRNPGRYRSAGAVGPRGVLMVGPPGTGKTLLAKAVAAEAGVPFFSVTGSSFVEMFVGVGAARVRDLFQQVRAQAPAILFIDELDAIGQRRSAGGLTGNDEREQTINELLAAMDGFDTTRDAPIVVLAATNRPQALDVALLRPGRFDRQVMVPLPTMEERGAILAVHSRGKTMAPDVDVDVVARRTPGFSGADLANLVNEAALRAVRDQRHQITAADLDAAQDRITLGLRDESHRLLPEERHSVAVHEAGHALVAALCEHADPVAKVTILPAGPSLGATHQLPEHERRLFTSGYLTDRITVAMAGRAAERLVLGGDSTGAAADLVDATGVATRMVLEFGMSPRLGPVSYAAPTGPQQHPVELPIGRPYAEATQRVVDTEVARFVREAEVRATDLLRAHRPALDRLVERLEAEETVQGAAVLEALAPERRRLGRTTSEA